jgi:hypothetical protein
LRPGLGPITIPIVSSDPGILSQKSLTVFPPNYDQVTTQFLTNTPGTATLQIGTLPGFSQAPPVDSVKNVTVTLNQFSLTSTNVGKDRSTSLGYFYSGSMLTTAHLASNDPSLVLLSTDPKGTGTSDVSFDMGPSIPATTVYVFGLGDAGTPTITATAPGFPTATSIVNLTPSSFVFSNPNQLTIRAGAATTARISTGSPIRGGIASVPVTISSSNSAVVQGSTITFQPGDSYRDIIVSPKATGTAILTILDAGGAPTPFVLIVTVTP